MPAIIIIIVITATTDGAVSVAELCGCLPWPGPWAVCALGLLFLHPTPWHISHVQATPGGRVLAGETESL